MTRPAKRPQVVELVRSAVSIADDMVDLEVVLSPAEDTPVAVSFPHAALPGSAEWRCTGERSVMADAVERTAVRPRCGGRGASTLPLTERLSTLASDAVLEVVH